MHACSRPRSRPAARLAQALSLSLLATWAADAEAADAPMKFRGSFSWITSYRHAEPLTESAVNPDNAALKIPTHTGATELRPNLKLEAGGLQLVVRPRVRADVSEIVVAEEKEPTRGQVEDELNAAYLQWAVSKSLTFAYGRQNYQWGAAESLSPSNRMFHEVAQSRNVLYDERGRDLARVNLTAGKSFSTVIMAELDENENQAAFAAEEEFQTSGLIKPELSWNNGADYFGVVVGAREGRRGWVGEYFNLSLPIPEGLSIYGDASHERGSVAWYPRADQPVVTFEQSLRQDDKVKTLAVGGLRYDFTGGTVLRAEYIYNESAWTEEERETALKAFDPANPAQLPLFETNARRFLAPGLDVPGRRFAFASIHSPDAFDIDKLTLYLRGTQSLTDGSAEAYASVEYGVGDAGTILLAVSGTAGDEGNELKGQVGPTQILAYRHDW